MNNREIFKDNLNYYLNISGNMQKDLAEYVGAKYTTVSGWVHGISYPRADAMEKIALFFGIPLSQLIKKRDDPNEELTEGKVPKTAEARILATGIDKLPKEQREQALSVIKAMFAKYSSYFEEGNDET